MQHYKNHRQVSYNYYFFTLLPTIILLIGSVTNLVNSARENLYSASLIVVVALILVALIFKSRSLSLKVQDRAIRAEENLRYFILTGKPIDPRISLQQIIALRFASDEEMPMLAQRAINEGLSNDAIKREIKNWREDNYRV